jgi:hypothetical protein
VAEREITLTLPAEVAIVVYEMIERYYAAAKPELVTDRAEWRALVLLSGALERSDLVHFDNYRELLADARRSLADYDGIPF